jgi:hypothetical protein
MILDDASATMQSVDKSVEEFEQDLQLRRFIETVNYHCNMWPQSHFRAPLSSLCYGEVKWTWSDAL